MSQSFEIENHVFEVGDDDDEDQDMTQDMACGDGSEQTDDANYFAWFELLKDGGDLLTIVKSWYQQLSMLPSKEAELLGPVANEVEAIYLELTCFVSAVEDMEKKFQAEQIFQPANDHRFQYLAYSLVNSSTKFDILSNQDVGGIIMRAGMGDADDAE